MGLNPLEQFNAVTVIGMIVVFWATLFALKSVFYNPVLDIIVARRQKIAAAKAEVAKADLTVAAAQTEADRILAQSDEEVDKIAREAAESVEAQRQESSVAAKEEAERVLAAGRTHVVEVRKQEEAKVRTELVGCTTIACNKLIGKVDGRLIESVVDKVMRARLAV